MITLVLADCPAGLRGLLTRWLTEISPGVFVGDPSARIRELVWEEVQTYRGRGRAVLAYSTDTEQGFAFATHEHRWHPVDHEGLTLIHRPSDRPHRTVPPRTPATRPGTDHDSVTDGPTTRPAGAPTDGDPATGWSKAAKRRRFGPR
ncbi:type I-E CRISPR-associated endoribonuclease Cas2e [Kitasatospora sp. NBC_00458]|uniref:type I-E CRISPR-associated endoribonuclease Cas2e n=1 Tax=Kitasatospora sp. NBC_00458 TaxID=2903568 RepID=UPI002E18451D